MASLIPIKNQALLLRALVEVRRHVLDVHLHIVGGGPLRSELERLAHSLNMAAAVTFHGEISHDRLPAYYRAADLCLLTSHYESQSMVALEAAACDRVTIGTEVGVLPELVPPEYLVSANDYQSLAGIITQLATNHDLRNQLSRQAHQRTMADFTLDQAIMRWLTLYEQPGRRSTPSPARTGRE